MEINKWFPIHLHTLPDTLKEVTISGAVVSVEWNYKQLGKYYNWKYQPCSENKNISVVEFFQNWKFLSEKTSFRNNPNIFFTIEGLTSIGDLSLLSSLKKKGLISYQLFHWLENEYYSPAKGVTQKGKQLFEVIKKNDIFLDLSHLNGQGLLNVLDTFSGRKIVSHVVCEDLLEWNLMRRSNSMTSDELRLCDAELYGVPFIDDLLSFNSSLISMDRKVEIQTVAEHLKYLSNIVGVDRVAIGPDYFDYQIVKDALNIEVKTIIGLEHDQGLQKLANALKALNLSNSEIQGIFWKNAMNIFCL